MSITLIATSTVGAGGAASIDFTSIPGTYTDLYLITSLRGTASGQYADVNLTINGQTSASIRALYSINGSTANSYTTTTLAMLAANGNSATAGTFSNGQVTIPNYTATGTKSLSSENVAETNATASQVVIVAGSVVSSAGITSISIPAIGFTFSQYSTASLYGITKGQSGTTTVA
jgi:hypothetical protein